MKKKIFAILVLVGAVGLSSCQEDSTMDDLLVDVESNMSATEGNNGAGGAGSEGNGSGGVGGN